MAAHRAAIIAMLAKRLRIPYAVSLVLGGLILGSIRLPVLSPLQPGQRPDWLTPDVILILFLPALVFRRQREARCARVAAEFRASASAC